MLNISLPDQIQTFVEERAIAGGFNSANDYVYHLIVREQERIAQQERVESLLVEGLESGEPIEVTDDWWEQKRVHYHVPPLEAVGLAEREVEHRRGTS